MSILLSPQQTESIASGAGAYIPKTGNRLVPDA